MPLLIVPLGPADADLLTLAEWDALRACDAVAFERPDHPLLGRLRAAGTPAAALEGEPSATDEGRAFVADPRSPRVVELARAGAVVSGAPAPRSDALTAAHGARVARRAASSMAGLAALMARLRSADGCPWDREQTHESLRTHLLEEAHEVLEAIDANRTGEELEEELGDLLLQVVFHAQLAADEQRFDLGDVADRIVAKLVHRHPHVFGEVEVAGAQEVVRNWEAIKADEKARSGPFADIPRSLPGLASAYKVQNRAASLGFASTEDDARSRLQAALARGTDASSLGEALFWLVALARAGGIDPEGALRSATARFVDALQAGDRAAVTKDN